ncbi:CHAT domain-containing protein [Flagelloscypha sp. PMI_526]|nr:CHAT domain-containing protein [Flagelloscypha sp. PMI_526]
MVHGALDKPTERVGEEEEYLDDVITSLGLEGTGDLKRFQANGWAVDIEAAIEKLGQAFDLIPHGHQNRPAILENLGIAHQTRFERFGEMVDMDKAIKYQRQAVDLTPHGHPNKPICLNSLGISHQTRFQRLGKMADIDKAIEYQRQAVDLSPYDCPNKPTYLNSLGISHQTRFQRLGKMVDIDKAIEYQRQAVDLNPDSHPNKPGHLSNLGISHQTRFERLGEMADIDKAVDQILNASIAELLPDSMTFFRYCMCLNNLGNSHLRRFEHLGEMAEIDKAIECQIRAVQITPDGHPDKPMYLNNLGTSHVIRFQYLGEMVDIDKAIEYQRQAVDLTPRGHPNKLIYLSNLGASHVRRFGRLGEMADINKAIESQRQAADLTPHDHPNKPMYLSNLGVSHQRRFERLGEMAEIDKAIEYQRQAVDLTPHGHPNKPMYLNNLGNSHQTRFQCLGTMVDIDKAIESQRQAVDLDPDGHPNKPMHLNNLGNSHQMRFEHIGEMADIDRAIANFEQSATSVVGPPINRFRAARLWISALGLKNQNFTFHTLSLRPQHTLINLIPELVWLGAPIHQRFQTIQDVVGSSIHEAVSAAIRAKELELAVEWMEQGRSIVWSQLRRLRSPLVDLQGAHPFLAQEFQDVQGRIEMSFLPRDVDSKSEPAPDYLEQQAQAHRCNIQKREDLLTEIRGKQGFESFLRPEKFSLLSKVCQDRLVVLLTAAGEQCDALVISPSSSVTHMSFTNMSQDAIIQLHTRWENSRSTQAATVDQESMSSLLADLWERIVHPIVVRTENDLFDLTGDRLPHITWCPSGPLSFLPFHAAGNYSTDSAERIGISDYAVSSYTPSLMALLSNSPIVQLGRPSILMVTQPKTPHQKPLPGTLREAGKILEEATLNGIKPHVHHLSHSEATVSAVIKQLGTHGWVHLACHGTQNFRDPMESSFALYDGSLTLESLMRKSMGRAQFAFLSACQTATGDKTLADEAIHLTSGMLAAGFQSVVGTMWSIEDSVAPEVARAFYAMLFEEGRKSEWKVKPEPVYALHFSLKKFREESTRDRDFMKWVPFVYYGI